MTVDSKLVANVLAVLSCIVFLVTTGCLLAYHHDRSVKIYLTIILLADVVPLVMSVVWFSRLYIRTRNATGRKIINAISAVAVGFLPIALCGALRSDIDFSLRKNLVILAAIDAAPFVLGLTWFLFAIIKPVKRFR